jgi:hypothetical protein
MAIGIVVVVFAGGVSRERVTLKPTTSTFSLFRHFRGVARNAWNALA